MALAKYAKYTSIESGAHQHDVVDLVLGVGGVLEHLLDRVDARAEGDAVERLELSAREVGLGAEGGASVSKFVDASRTKRVTVRSYLWRRPRSRRTSKYL